MSIMIKCDICGTLMPKEPPTKYHKLIIVSQERIGMVKYDYHICDACKRDVDKMLHVKENDK